VESIAAAPAFVRSGERSVDADHELVALPRRPGPPVGPAAGRAARPPRGRGPGAGTWRALPPASDGETVPGTLVTRISGPVYFANVTRVHTLLLEYADAAPGLPRVLVVDLVGARTGPHRTPRAAVRRDQRHSRRSSRLTYRAATAMTPGRPRQFSGWAAGACPTAEPGTWGGGPPPTRGVRRGFQ